MSDIGNVLGRITVSLERAGIPLTPLPDWQLHSRGRLIGPLGE